MYNIRFRNLLGCLAMLLTFNFVLVIPAIAQRYLGSIAGEVSDPSGAKVEGARGRRRTVYPLQVDRGY